MLNSLVHSPTGYDTTDQWDIELSWIMNSSMNFMSVCYQGMSFDFKEHVPVLFFYPLLSRKPNNGVSWIVIRGSVCGKWLSVMFQMMREKQTEREYTVCAHMTVCQQSLALRPNRMECGDPIQSEAQNQHFMWERACVFVYLEGVVNVSETQSAFSLYRCHVTVLWGRRVEREREEGWERARLRR